MQVLFSTMIVRVARLILALTILAFAGAAQTAPAFSTLYSFTGGANGANPGAEVIIETNGSLFGTTPYGGTEGYGTVFELTPGTPWTQAVLYSFGGGNDGANPAAALTLGTGGVLYGTTAAGGSSGNGMVFQLTPPAKTGDPWTETVLYSFKGGTADGSGPQGSVTRIANGVLYGTTFTGGAGAAGTVFQLTPPTSAGAWTETVIYNFKGGKDGSGPESGVIVSGGELYGTTCCGTVGGTVFKLVPKGGGGWGKQILVSFSSYSQGAFPYGSLAMNSSGVVYGTTTAGGASGAGILFSLTPGATGEPYTMATIHSFTNGTDGGAPYGGLTLGSHGELYATVTAGCSFGNGGVLLFTPPAHGTGAWSETVLYNFMGTTDGSEPFAGVTLGSSSNTLYGTTTFGGAAGPADYGTVFELIL